MSPAPKSKLPSLLWCWQPAPAQPRSGSALGPAPAQPHPDSAPGPALDQHQLAPPCVPWSRSPQPSKPGSSQPSRWCSSVAQPEFGSCQCLPWSEGWAAGQPWCSRGAWVPWAHASPEPPVQAQLRCSHAASKLKPWLGALPPPPALHAASRGSHGPARRWLCPCPPRGPSLSPPASPRARTTAGHCSLGASGGAVRARQTLCRSSWAGGSALLGCIVASNREANRSSAAAPRRAFLVGRRHAMAREGGCRCPRGPPSPAGFSPGAQEGSGEVHAHKRPSTSSASCRPALV